MILLIIGSSTEPALFHASRRPSHHVGIFPALTSDLLVRKACPTLTSDHVGTNPIITSERPSTHIHHHDRTQLLSFVKRIGTYNHPLVENEELTTTWLKILVTTGFSSDLLLNMNNFDWPNYKRLKLMTNLVTSLKKMRYYIPLTSTFTFNFFMFCIFKVGIVFEMAFSPANNKYLLYYNNNYGL